MAVTKLLRIKENRGRDPAAGLRRNLFYICNPQKTDGGRNIGGSAGHTPAEALATMKLNKQLWGKEDGSQGFHYILSFDPSCEVSIGTAHAVAEEFCRELLGERYYYLYAIHNDQQHLHIHITFDSVSFEDGKKYHSPKGDWEKTIQPITDRICRRYGLPTLDYQKERSGVDYGEWKHRREIQRGDNGQTYSWLDVIRDDVEEALVGCRSYEQLLTNLKNMHYRVRDGKYLSLCPPGKEKAVRTGRLGKGYSKEDLQLRIAGRDYRMQKPGSFITYGNAQEIRDILYYKKERFPGWHMNEFQRQFYRRWRRTYLIRRPGFADSWKYKKDIVELQKISDCIRYMVDHDISGPDDIHRMQDESLERNKELTAARSAASSQLYKSEVLCNLRRYMQIMDRPAQGEEDLKHAQELKEKIESRMPLNDACEKMKYLKEHRKQIGALLRENRNEQKLLSSMERLFLDPIHPDRNKDYYREIRLDRLEEIERLRRAHPNERTVNNEDHTAGYREKR